jgi:ankyrin repeat protein
VNRGPAFVKQKNSSLLKRDDMNGVNVLSDFWTAAFYGTQTEVDRYIEAGQDVNEPNFLAPHDTALHNAAAGRSVELVKHLVETRGAKVEILDSNQNTPLHSAARAGDVSVVKYLLQNQSASMEQDAVNQLGLTPWGVAYKFGNHDACKVLPKPTDMAMGKLKLAFKMQRSQIFQSAARPSSSGGYDPLRPKSPFGVELDVGSESTKTAVHKMAMF